MANVGELVDGIASAALAGVEAQLRPDGAVMPPTMFILAEHGNVMIAARVVLLL